MAAFGLVGGVDKAEGATARLEDNVEATGIVDYEQIRMSEDGSRDVGLLNCRVCWYCMIFDEGKAKAGARDGSSMIAVEAKSICPYDS